MRLTEQQQAAIALGHAGEEATVRNLLEFAATLGLSEAIMDIPLRLFYGYTVTQAWRRPTSAAAECELFMCER